MCVDIHLYIFRRVTHNVYPDGLMTPPTSPQGAGPALHPLLVYDPSGRIRCDITRDVAHVRLRPGLSPTALNEYALHPSVTHVTINIPGSAWQVKITNARGITVRDILSEICESMCYHVGNTEFQAFAPQIRDAALRVFQRRGGAEPGGFQSGLRRFDFMGGNMFFVGLRKARDGFSWDANFASFA